MWNLVKECTYSIATVTDSMVDLVTARIQFDANISRQLGARNGSCETMPGMMAMGISSKACLAEVEILTLRAVQKFTLGKLCRCFVSFASKRSG